MARKTNCEKHGKNYYRLTVTLGRTAEGKLVRKDFYAESKKEAEKLRDEYMNMINSGAPMDYKNVTLGELMHLWLYEIMYVSDMIKPSTFERYEGVYRNYIKNSELYFVNLSELKSIQIQRYYNRIYCSGKTSSSIRTLNKILKAFLNYALEEGYINRNPCSSKKLVIPGRTELKKESVEVFSENEIMLIKETLKGDRLECLILLALGTGLRQGELLALSWDDIDLTRMELHVNKTLKRQPIFDKDMKKTHTFVLLPPKSKTSNRTVPIPSSLIPIIKRHRTMQLEEKLKAGSSYTNMNLVFCTQTGNFINQRNIIRAHERLLNRAGVSYRKFHTYRHTYATKLFEAKIPLKTIQTLLGHSDITMTANIYTHVMPKERITAVEKLNRLFV